MLELLNQLDGFTSDTSVKVIAATNRIDILDPALLRSGRIDRKIEFPLPNEESRARILQIHSRKMNVKPSTGLVHLSLTCQPSTSKSSRGAQRTSMAPCLKLFALRLAC